MGPKCISDIENEVIIITIMGNSLYCTQNGTVVESSPPNAKADEEVKTAASSPDKT